MARPTSYREEYATAVAEGGALSPSGIAYLLGVHRDTVYQWTKRHPAFAQAVRAAQAQRAAWLEGLLLAERTSGARLNAIRLALFNCAPEEWTGNNRENRK